MILNKMAILFNIINITLATTTLTYILIAFVNFNIF